MAYRSSLLEQIANPTAPAIMDPLQRAGKLAEIQNAMQSGQLQQQQIQAGGDAAKSRQSAMQADADVVRIMQGAKFDPDGTLDAPTEAALIQNASPHAQAILTNLSTVGVRKSTIARDAAQTQQGKDTLAETVKNNVATQKRESDKATAEANKPIVVNGALVSPTGSLLYGAPKEAPSKALQLKEVNFKSGPAKHGPANFNPETGKLTDPATGQDITANVAGDYHEPPQSSIKSTDARLSEVDPKDYTEAKKEALKAETAYVAAQRASNDLNTFVSGAKAGNRVAAQYSPVEAVLQINAGAGVKRINRQEIDQMAGAGSIFDRIAGWAGHATAGQPIPPNILADMQNLSELLAGNAKAQRDSQLKAVDKIYNSKFSDAAPATRRYNPVTGKIE